MIDKDGSRDTVEVIPEALELQIRQDRLKSLFNKRGLSVHILGDDKISSNPDLFQEAGPLGFFGLADSREMVEHLSADQNRTVGEMSGISFRTYQQEEGQEVSGSEPYNYVSTIVKLTSPEGANTYLAFVQDEDDRAEIARFRAEREFISKSIDHGVSHDIKTPLSVISTSAYLIGKAVPENQKVAELLSVVVNVQRALTEKFELFSTSEYASDEPSPPRFISQQNLIPVLEQICGENTLENLLEVFEEQHLFDILDRPYTEMPEYIDYFYHTSETQVRELVGTMDSIQVQGGYTYSENRVLIELDTALSAIRRIRELLPQESKPLMDRIDVVQKQIELLTSHFERYKRLIELKDQETGSGINSDFRLEDAIQDALANTDKYTNKERATQPGLKINAALVRTDRELLGLALNEVIGNARIFTDQGKNADTLDIQTRVSTRGDEIVINISDNGRGIRDYEQNLIFAATYQADNASRQGKRAGLGLAITAEALRIIGGTVHVRRSEVGSESFTEVQIRIPNNLAAA